MHASPISSSRIRRSIPLELDGGADRRPSPIQIYFKIYLPLMAPALSRRHLRLLVAWNEYLYQFLLRRTSEHDRTGGARPIPQQRRGAVELHDGDGDHLRHPADRDLRSGRKMSGGLTMGAASGQRWVRSAHPS